MKQKVAATLVAASLVCACQSTSKKQTLAPFPPPPLGVETSTAAVATGSDDPVAVDYALEKRFRETPTEPMRFLVRYLQAKLWSPIDESKACALWLEVSENPHFPLIRMARLRAIETCPAARPEIPPLITAEAALAPEPWMKEVAVRASLAHAVKAGDKATEMKLSSDVARLEKMQTAQLKLLARSRQLAQELGDTSIDAQALDQTEKLAPRLIQEPKPAQYMLVAGDFKRSREFDQARKYYKLILDGSDFNDGEKLKALDGIRMSYKLEQKREKFIETTREYSDFARSRYFAKVKKPTQLAKYMDTRLTLARAIWTENGAREAEEILHTLEKEIKGRYPVDESLFLRARIEEENGRLDHTVQLLSRIDERRLTDKASRLKIGWYRAWNLRKVGHFADAAELLKKLAKDEAQSPQEARDRFWLARTYKDMGDTFEAGAQFAWLMNNDPIGYYGMLSYRETQQGLPTLAPPSLPAQALVRAPADENAPPPVAVLARADDDARALTPEERLTFDWLVAGSESELARRYLDGTASERRANFTEEQTVDFLKAYARAGAYQALFARLYELKPEVRRQILDKQPELIFPRPWRTLVDKAAAQYQVKPELIYSIMRQESSFNPRARSFADAFGLMQLIPEVAARAGKNAGVTIQHPEDLYRPEMNIPLGSAFLQELFKKWDGRFIPSVASYNASEKAVAGWLKNRDRKDVLAFIEDIPYEETKGYVKLVMRNFVFYSRMRSSQAAADGSGATLPFPEWCLSGIQDAKL